MNENNDDGLIERIVAALKADVAPEWNPAPSWADYVLTWEGLRCLANDLLGRRPYDGRDPLARPALNEALVVALKAEGYVVLCPAQDDAIRRGLARYGPLCPAHEARYKYQARKIGAVPGRGECSCCGRKALGGVDDVGAQEVAIYVW